MENHPYSVNFARYDERHFEDPSDLILDGHYRQLSVAPCNTTNKSGDSLGGNDIKFGDR
jgi:hypothetical protein